MCFFSSPKAPNIPPPPPPPAAAKAPSVPGGSRAALNRKKALAAGRGSTILTQGVLAGSAAPGQKKTLLGQ